MKRLKWTSFFVILLSSTIYYVVGYYFFQNNYSQYFFVQNHISDETTYYFRDLFFIFHKFNYKDISIFFDTRVISKLFNFIIFIFTPKSFYPLLINFITTGFLIFTLYKIGKEILYFDQIFNIAFVTIFIITLGWSIFTYKEWIEIIFIKYIVNHAFFIK